MKCPSCGSDEVSEDYREHEARVPYGPTIKAACILNKCSKCDFTGDIDQVNDARIERATVESTQASIPVMVDILKGNGYTLVYCERALRLPFGTFKKWVTDPAAMDPAAVVMLRMVATYPWLLQAADDNFTGFRGSRG